MNNGEVRDQPVSPDIDTDHSKKKHIEDFTDEVYAALDHEHPTRKRTSSPAIKQEELETYDKKQSLDKVVYDRLDEV